ncbi:MAG: hypothetical protein DRN90_05435 [Thermoproteota archaeon]|nr:MAG: hypothetical protein DRN90_05435 [Candidatus Korarchaeota archaeon]
MTFFLMLLTLLGQSKRANLVQAEEISELERLSNLFKFVLRGIQELPQGSSLKNPGEVAWIGGLLYYLATPGGAMEPHLYINLYAAAILEFSIENKDLLGLSDRDVTLAKERIASICSHFLFSTARSINPPGGWVDFSRGNAMSIEVTTDVLKVIVKAQKLGIIPNSGPEHTELAKAVSALIRSQNANGGWGKYPESIIEVEKMSDPYFTAKTLEALLAAKKVGFSVDSSIRKAISFLQSSAKKEKSKAHWSTVLTAQKELYGDSFVTARVLEALIAAHMDGYEVDIELLKQASRYESEYLNTVQGFREASFVIRALCYSSALGLMDTTDVIRRGNYFVAQLEEGQREEGYWSLYPPGAPHFLWDDLSYSYHASLLLIEWFWITSLDIDVDYEGPLTEYEPPRFVENDTMKVRLTLSNLASEITLNLRIEVSLPPGCTLMSEEGDEMTLSPGQSAIYEATIKAPESVQGLTPATIAFIISESSTGAPIRSRLLELELARNAKLEIISKQIEPDELYLGEEAVITVELRNSGEVPASTVAIAEELGEGFLIITEGSPNASVASTIAVGQGFPIGRIEPGDTVTYGFRIKASSPHGGNVIASTTKITYLDPLGNVREIEKRVNITVKRPEVLIGLNTSDFTMKWHQSKAISINLTNEGNSLAKDVTLQVRADKELSIKLISKPEGSKAIYEKESNRQRITVAEVAPNETVNLVIEVDTGWFYPSISKLTSLLVSVEYKDERNKFFEDYQDAEAIQITLLMSNLAKGLILLVLASIVSITILRVRAAIASRPRRKFRRARRFG